MQNLAFMFSFAFYLQLTYIKLSSNKIEFVSFAVVQFVLNKQRIFVFDKWYMTCYLKEIN